MFNLVVGVRGLDCRAADDEDVVAKRDDDGPEPGWNAGQRSASACFVSGCRAPVAMPSAILAGMSLHQTSSVSIFVHSLIQ